MTTWYVAPSGSDKNSSKKAQNRETPRQTIKATLDLVGGSGAGDVVEVADGVYTEAIYDIPPGTASNPFTLKAANPGGAIIRPDGGERILNINASHIVIDGFVLDGVNVQGNNIWIQDCEDVTLQNCELKNVQPGGGEGENSFQGIFAYHCAQVVIRNCRIHDVGPSSRYSHGIYWDAGDVLIEGNVIWNTGGNCMQIYGADVTGTHTMRGNRLYDYAQAGVGNGIYTVGTGDQMVNNLCYQTRPNPNAVGISVEGSGNHVLHNTVYQNGYMGIMLGGGNTAKNNIAFNNGVDIENAGGSPIEANLTGTDPLFVSPTSDFHLQGSSPAIDAGVATDVTVDYDGNARTGTPDIGAYEYTTSGNGGNGNGSSGGSDTITVSLAMNPQHPQKTETQVTFAATPKGGKKPYSYKWWFQNEHGEWAAMTDWTPSHAYGWTPTVACPSYMWSVWVRGADTTEDSSEFYADVVYPITGK